MNTDQNDTLENILGILEIMLTEAKRMRSTKLAAILELSLVECFYLKADVLREQQPVLEHTTSPPR